MIAYSVTFIIAEADGAYSAQQDAMQNFGEFESTAFRDVNKIFLALMYQFLTLYDEIFGTSAADDQVKGKIKKILHGKAYCRLYCTCPFSCFSLSNIRRRREKLLDAAKNHIGRLLEGRGYMDLNTAITTVDRGYGKE